MSHNLVIHNNRVVCPRCDENGFLYKTLIKPINITIIMCDECEATWPSSTEFATENIKFNDFTTYIQKLGYTYNEIELTNIDYSWHEK